MITDPGKHYRFTYKGVKLDPYRIFKVYEITDPAIQHAIKKLLVMGGRGKKSPAQDVNEAIASLQRWLEMQAEDGAPYHGADTTPMEQPAPPTTEDVNV